MADASSARQAFPQAIQKIESSPLTQATNQAAMGVAANPVAISDATKQQMIGAQSDQAVLGYNQGRRALRSSLARAGALDSATGGAKELQLAQGLSGQLQGIQRGADISQAQTNFGNRLQTLSGLSGAQGQQANQIFTGARGGVSAAAMMPIQRLNVNQPLVWQGQYGG